MIINAETGWSWDVAAMTCRDLARHDMFMGVHKNKFSTYLAHVLDEDTDWFLAV